MKKLRRTMLFVPANNPNMMFNSAVFGPDCIAFDLEDAITVREKDAARLLLEEALKDLSFGDCEIFARINPLSTPFGEADVRTLVATGLRNIRYPMCETRENVIELSQLLDEVEEHCTLPRGTVQILASIETARGVVNATEIATASERVTAISFGAEDFTNSMGIERSATGEELLAARSQIALAASAAGVDSFDTVYIDIDNVEGFTQEVKMARKLGFSGKSVIHPRQIDIVHGLYIPSAEEINFAQKVITAIQEAEEQGKGVITVDGRMVDVPIVEKAHRVMTLARWNDRS